MLPKLADGIELIGPYQGSGYREPKYLVSRADGQVIQLPSLLYSLAGQLDGQRDLTQLATTLSTEYESDITADQVSYLVEEKLRPAGIVEGTPDDPNGVCTQPAKLRPDALLLLRYRVPVLPPRVVGAIATVFQPLFWPPVVVAALVALVALDASIVLTGGLGEIVPSAVALVQQPTLTLLVLASIFACGMFHESGHVAACRYGGARPGTIGVGIYIVWPAMYSTVTDSYRLSRVGRLRTDLGGVYFNAIFMAGIGLAYLGTGEPWLLVALLLLHVETAWQFLPSIRLDGYYILADLVGVPDLFSLLGPVLKGLLPGRPVHPRVAELKPWARRVISLWVVLTVPLLLYFVAWFLLVMPHILPVVWATLNEMADRMLAAARAGEVAEATLGAVNMFLLTLPWLGAFLIASTLGRTLTNLVRNRLHRSTGRHAAWSPPQPGARATKWLIAAALPVAALAAVATAAVSRRVATASEAGIAAAAAVAGRGDPGGALSLSETLVVYQVAAVQALLPGEGPAAVMDAARAAFLAVGVLGCLLVWPVARRLGLSGPAAAAAVLMCGLPAPLVALHASVEAGGLAAVWLTLAAAVVGRGRTGSALAAVATAVAVLTAPLAAVALLAAAAAVLLSRTGGGRRSRLLGAAAACAALAGALAATGGHALTVSAALPAAALLCVGTLTVATLVAAIKRPELRAATAAAGALLVCAALPGTPAPTALLLAAPVLAVLAAVVLAELTRRAARGWRSRVVAVAAIALAVVAVVPTVAAGGTAPTDPTRLSDWISSELDPDTALLVDPFTRAQLLRDGVAADRLILDAAAAPPGALIVVAQGPGPRPDLPRSAQLLVTVDPGPWGAPAAVYRTGPNDDDGARALGARLARDRALTLDPPAAAALRSGEVDSRLVAVLAGLAAEHELAIADFPVLAGEPASAPRRTVLITAVDGEPVASPGATDSVQRWLTTRRVPYRPAEVTLTDGVLSVRYTVAPSYGSPPGSG